MNDEMAIGTIQAATGHRRVRKYQLRRAFGPRADYHRPTGQSDGRAGLQTADDRIEAKAAEDAIHVLPHELIVRQSGGPARTPTN